MVSRYNVMVLALLLTGQGSCKRSTQQDLEKYVAASTEDIARVFQLEKDLWSHLKEYQEGSASNKDVDVINKFLTDTKFIDIVEDDSLEHVSNPFHAYHCLKRTTRLWEKMVLKLSKQNKLKKVKQLLRRFPEEEDFQEGAAFGLLTIQLYYNISFTVICYKMVTTHSAHQLQEMMRGQVLGELMEDVRLPPLDVEDALQISRVAKYAQRLDKQVHSFHSQRPLALAF